MTGVRLTSCLACAVSLVVSNSCIAGVHYSGEKFAEPPSKWSGYIRDHRLLRILAAPPQADIQPHPFREEYIEARDRLVKAASKRELTAEEAADLGALHIRFGNAEKAVETLRAAQRQFPEEF